MESRFAKNTTLLLIGNLLSKGLSFIMVPFFTRWLTTEDYGTFDLFCTYVTLMIPFVNLATGEAIFRFSVQENATEGDRKRYISNGLAVTLVNLLVVTAVLTIVRFATSWEYAIPFLLLLIGELFNDFMRSFLRAIKKLNIYSICNALSILFISMFVTMFVRLFEMGLTGIILGYAMGYILGNLCIAILAKLPLYISIKSVSIRGMKGLIAYSFPLITNNISWWVINASDRLIINYVIGPVANGIYAVANKIPSVCSAVFGVFNISWQEEASEIVEKGNWVEVRTYFNRVYNELLKRILSICMVVLSFNFIFFRFVFDTKYIEAYKYSPILVTSIIFMLMTQFYGGIQIALKMPKENGITTFLGAVINVVINIALIKFIGIYAAAISTLISYIFVIVLRRKKTNNSADIKISRRNLVYVGVYVYFFAASYVINATIFSIVNVVLACSVFVYVNSDIIKSFCYLLNVNYEDENSNNV